MTGRIMIVEDEGVAALDIENILLTAGYHVAAMTSTGREAIQKAQETLLDLALVDIGLKGPIDGIELARVLQERFNLAVVFLTAYTDQQMMARASLVRPLGYVIKPFEQAELLSSIEEALRECRNGRRRGPH